MIMKTVARKYFVPCWGFAIYLSASIRQRACGATESSAYGISRFARVFCGHCCIKYDTSCRMSLAVLCLATSAPGLSSFCKCSKFILLLLLAFSEQCANGAKVRSRMEEFQGLRTRLVKIGCVPQLFECRACKECTSLSATENDPGSKSELMGEKQMWRLLIGA